MNPGSYNITIQQGMDFHIEFAWSTKNGAVITPVDLTGFAAKMQIIPLGTTDDPIELSTTGTAPAITINQNKFVIDLTDEQTKNYDFKSAKYEFEVISPTGIKSRMLRGRINIDKELLQDE